MSPIYNKIPQLSLPDSILVNTVIVYKILQYIMVTLTVQNNNCSQNVAMKKMEIYLKNTQQNCMIDYDIYCKNFLW